MRNTHFLGLPLFFSHLPVRKSATRRRNQHQKKKNREVFLLLLRTHSIRRRCRLRTHFSRGKAKKWDHVEEEKMRRRRRKRGRRRNQFPERHTGRRVQHDYSVFIPSDCSASDWGESLDSPLTTSTFFFCFSSVKPFSFSLSAGQVAQTAGVSSPNSYTRTSKKLFPPSTPSSFPKSRSVLSCATVTKVFGVFFFNLKEEKEKKLTSLQ